MNGSLTVSSANTSVKHQVLGQIQAQATGGHYEKYSNRGWICPKCGKVNAPHIDSCGCYNGSWVNELPQGQAWANPCGGCPNYGKASGCLCTIGQQPASCMYISYGGGLAEAVKSTFIS